MIHDAFDCKTLVELVTDWLEGTLDEPARSELELHVATCPGCLAYIEQMRSTSGMLASLESVEPTDETVGTLVAVFRARRPVTPDPAG